MHLVCVDSHRNGVGMELRGHEIKNARGHQGVEILIRMRNPIASSVPGWELQDNYEITTNVLSQGIATSCLPLSPSATCNIISPGAMEAKLRD